MAEPGTRSAPVGPGDVLGVWVVGIKALKDEEQVQVSDSGNVTLPFVGTIDVQGMSLEQVVTRLEQAYSEYIKAPEVHVAMEENRNQAVAVMGLVNKPEVVPLTMPDETIMDVIGDAGGLANGASQRVLLIPAAARAQSAAAGVMATNTGPCAATAAACGADPPAAPGRAVNAAYQGAAYRGAVGPGAQGRIAPVVLDLHSSANQGCLDLPVRAGDTVVVPPAGNVMVGGWVDRAGEVPITPGMTVLGAITAAGGALYSSNVEVLRTNPEGKRTAIPVDLAAVKSGKQPDPTVEAGDVVMVEGSVLGALPYAFHSLFNGVSGGIPIPVP
jgi:protein involved in polysaccharide export with SLBB domain